MNTLEKLQQNLADALSQVEELKKQLEKEQQKPARKGRFIPAKWEEYYNITASGEIFCRANTGTAEELSRIEIGNCYSTREEAERAVKAQKVRVRLRDLAEEFKPDWGDESQKKWYITFNNHAKKYEAFYTVWWRLDVPAFMSEEKALAAIEELGSDLDYLREDGE